jgi:hypothetical protein
MEGLPAAKLDLWKRGKNRARADGSNACSRALVASIASGIGDILRTVTAGADKARAHEQWSMSRRVPDWLEEIVARVAREKRHRMRMVPKSRGLEKVMKSWHSLPESLDKNHFFVELPSTFKNVPYAHRL